MNMLARRRMLLAISHLALGTALTGCGEATAPRAAAPAAVETDLALLASVAYDLFPFPDLPPALYVQVGERVLQNGGPALTEGLQQLRAVAGANAWRELDEAQRIEALVQLQSGAFFAQLRAATIEVLYRSPETFAMVNYGGSAIEYGGYLHRGFNEIDWLPTAQ